MSDGQSVRAQGRIVWTSGDLFKGKAKVDDRTKMPVIDPKTQQQVIEYGFGLAVPKNLCGEIWRVMHEEAFKTMPGATAIPPNFAMKYKDGDGADDKGILFSQRAIGSDGKSAYAGCMVFALTTRIPIKYFKWENNDYVLINDNIKCGDYVDAQVLVKGHGAVGQGKPGLYLNPLAVLFLGFGEAIVSAGPTGSQIFGSAPPQMPAGASATPVAMPGFPTQSAAPVGMPMMPQTQGYAAQGAQAQFAPPQQQMPGMMPQAPQQQAQPHYAVMPQGFAPPQQQAPQVPQFQQPMQQQQFAPPPSPGLAAVPIAQNVTFGGHGIPPGMPMMPGYPQQ